MDEGTSGGESSDYTITCHAHVNDLSDQVYRLAREAFGQYPGVLRPSARNQAWYVARPGMDRHLSMAALHHGQLVSNVLVTVVNMYLAGRLRSVGVLDTVMTHREHRRRGLARRLLEEAIEGMRARGLAASLLCTLPESMPYRLYQTLGYRPHVTLHYYRREGGDKLLRPYPLHRATESDDARLREFLDARFEGCEGYVPLDDALWAWRRHQRSDDLPAEVWFVEEGDRVLGTLTVCRAPIVGPDHAEVSYVLTDLAISGEADADAVMASLLTAVPVDVETLVISASVNEETNRLLGRWGFTREASEVAMLLPFEPEIEAKVAFPPTRWYVLVESAIGI